MRSDLITLAERVEALSEPDREVEMIILRYITHNVNGAMFWNHDNSRVRGDDGSTRFTTSIDAAMTLVPEGYQVEMGCYTDVDGFGAGIFARVSKYAGGDGPRFDGADRSEGATLALALTAACLRAIAAQETKV